MQSEDQLLDQLVVGNEKYQPNLKIRIQLLYLEVHTRPCNWAFQIFICFVSAVLKPFFRQPLNQYLINSRTTLALYF